jgi:uncharacterized protein YjbI with pentapeptide repeats
MTKSGPKLKVKKPENVFKKPLEADLKKLFIELSKAIGHATCGKWEEISTDTIEALSAIGLATKPDELAFLLIRRSITKALFKLVGESAGQQLTDTKTISDKVVDQLDFSTLDEVYLDYRFLDRPTDLPFINNIQQLLKKWFEGLGISNCTASAIADRLPSYFVYALNQEWRRNGKSYRPLIEALATPFTKAGDREWAWAAYSALLKRRIQEGIFDEPFSLSQMYIPLNAFYYEEKDTKEFSEEMPRKERPKRRVIVSLQEELEDWLQKPNPQDAIRVISGGPGSGKSSFARVFAAKLSENPKLKVIYIPLHLIDPSKDLTDEIGRFVKDEGVLLQNPLDPDSPEPNLLIIFDGLDELSSQGKAAAETARSFVREVDRTVEKRNLQSVRLRVLISGRELVVQENESEFRHPRQILILLPYFVPGQSEHERPDLRGEEEYHDPRKLLKTDLRKQWWKNYGALTGKGYNSLPKELSREDLTEITAQPLLNYLVALSYTRDKLDFTKDINLNSIYADLIDAVHERGYEKHRPYQPIRHMKPDEFSRVLEEIGMAAWHGDGRTTTVREIEEHCRASGVGVLLDAFETGAKAGVTRLLAAFFFRQYGQRPSGDPTFVFTHKSFGEYLTARRIVRAIDRINIELESRTKDPDRGWDEKEALKHWGMICGRSAISTYLHNFLLNEIKLRPIKQLSQWQSQFTKLFSYMLRHGMPMEQLQINTFKDSLFQSRNAEEALLVALNSCARITKQISAIEYPDPTTFGAWFKRIQGQRTGRDSILAAQCLSFLNLANTIIYISDFYMACLISSNLNGVHATFATFAFADLRGAGLQEADLQEANLQEANLHRANLHRANLQGAILQGAILQGANLQGAILERANLERANLERANLQGAKLQGANLERANLQGANLEGANLQGANLEGANLQETILQKNIRKKLNVEKGKKSKQ